MSEALALARHALGRTAPNPAVGAVIVDGSGIVGRGWTQPPGGPHAEVMALAEAGVRAVGATLYITLEPCCHHGRTPPCTEAIIAAGIARCVVAISDPFPLVDGGGIARLRAAGIPVALGVKAEEATELNAGYVKWQRTGRPLVVAKYAMTADGRIASRTGQSRWITGELAREAVHRMRDRVDAVMAGVGTVTVDDPALTTRIADQHAGAGGPHHPLRVIVDGRGVSPLGARVFDPTQPGTTLVATTHAAPAAWLRHLADRGVDAVICGDGPSVDLVRLLDLLGERGVNTLLVEGGSRLLGALFDEGLVDRVAAFVAPVLVGGSEAPGPIGGTGVGSMAAAIRLVKVRWQRYGDDMLLEGDVAPPASKEVA